MEPLATLREVTCAVLDDARVRPGERRGDSHVNTTGGTLITPGGDYPGLWPRDFSMAVDTGLVSEGEMVHALGLLAAGQSLFERRLGSGAVIPAGAIPDHVLLDGSPCFFPGSMSAGEDQGAGEWGPRPPMDNAYEFVHLAWHCWGRRGVAALREGYAGLSLWERVLRAFAWPRSHGVHDGVVCEAWDRGVGFGFQDTVFLTGSMCLVSLLRRRAAREIGDMAKAMGDPGLSAKMAEIIARIEASLPDLFQPDEAGGWLIAATGIGRQPDVWATLWALYQRVLRGRAYDRAWQAVLDGWERGTFVRHAAVRHVPTDRSYSPDRVWEQAAFADSQGQYQSGGYWHLPVGWLIVLLRRAGRTQEAEELLSMFITHLREQAKAGAPWECYDPATDRWRNPRYLASVAVPLSVLSERPTEPG